MIKLGFRSKIYLGILCPLLLFGIMIFLIVSSIMKDALLEENRNRGFSISTHLAARVVELILATDLLRMKTLADETVKASDDIFYTFVLDRDQRPLVHTFKSGFPVELRTANTVADNQDCHIRLLDTSQGLVYDFAVPVLIGDDRLGTIRLGLLQTGVHEAITRLMWSASASTALAILMAAIVGTLLARPATRRIKLLQESSEQALRGNLDVQTAPRLKQNCWEIMHCDHPECPAYGNYAHRCWYLAGTMCPCCVEGEYAKKFANCRQCPVYRKCSGDEIQTLAESFDAMIQSLRTHLSDLQDAEKILKDQRQLLKTILDATPDFVSLQDRQSVYRSVNKAFCQITGRKEEEVIGKSDFDLLPFETAQAYRQEDLQVFDSGQPLIIENKSMGRKGNRWFHVMKIPVYGADGKIMGLLCHGRDITEFKRVQEQLLQAQKMDAIGQLIAGIAHEINTPLGIILGYAQLMLEDVPTDSQLKADLQTVEKQTQICRKIVSDLLNFSRHSESTMGPLDVNQTIEEVLSVVQHTYSLDRVALVRSFAADLPAIVGDREKLKQAIINLVNNAHDAIGTDGTITVSTGYASSQNEVVISVHDTGCGIPADKIDKIFDPFFTTKAVDKGTGLGLSVTFGIIKDHGGRIEVESPAPCAADEDEPELCGSIFTIHLPAAGRTSQTDQKNEAIHVENPGA